MKSFVFLYTLVVALFLLVKLIIAAPVITIEKISCEKKVLDPKDPKSYCLEMSKNGNHIKEGTVCLLRIDEIHPTQMSVGKDVTHCLRKQLEKMTRNEVIEFLEKYQIPIVYGPKSNFYMLDLHHRIVSLYESFFEFEDRELALVTYACIQSDLRTMEIENFWTTLANNGFAYMKDYNGNDIGYEKMAKSIKELNDDPFRTLSKWVEDSLGYIKCVDKKQYQQCEEDPDTPFYIEFKWANFLRKKLPPSKDHSFPSIESVTDDNFIYRTSYGNQRRALFELLPEALKLVQSDEAKDLPGFNKYASTSQPIEQISFDKDGCSIKMDNP